MAERQRLEAAIAAEHASVQALLAMSAEWAQVDRLREFVTAARDAGMQAGQTVDLCFDSVFRLLTGVFFFCNFPRASLRLPVARRE